MTNKEAIKRIKQDACIGCENYETSQIECLYEKCPYYVAICSLWEEPCEGVVKIPSTGIGDLSDGYHTFNGLYHQRMILFAALVKAYKEKAWKSYRHEDGELCFGGGWFIVGIDTPKGSYTYHYENKYWSMFDCVELQTSKHWDGHTEDDAETRLMSLSSLTICEDAISREAVEKITWQEPSYSDPLNVLTDVRDRVRMLPSVKPQTVDWDWMIEDINKLVMVKASYTKESFVSLDEVFEIINKYRNHRQKRTR